MNGAAGARIASLVAAITGGMGFLSRTGFRRQSRRNKVSRRREPGAPSYTQWLRAKFAKSALERYGLDELLPSGKPNPATVRLMRNARKRERAIRNETPAQRRRRLLRASMRAKYGEAA